MTRIAAANPLRFTARSVHREIQLCLPFTPKCEWRPMRSISALIVLIRVFNWLPKLHFQHVLPTWDGIWAYDRPRGFILQPFASQGRSVHRALSCIWPETSLASSLMFLFVFTGELVYLEANNFMVSWLGFCSFLRVTDSLQNGFDREQQVLNLVLFSKWFFVWS